LWYPKAILKRESTEFFFLSEKKCTIFVTMNELTATYQQNTTGLPEVFAAVDTGSEKSPGKINGRFFQGIDYYPFGSLMPGRNMNASDYRFGFNSMEKDDEFTGVTGSHLNFGARIYDSRVGRFLSLDSKARNYPFWSPYLFAANNPIRFIDVDGFGPGDGTLKVYMTTAMLKNGDVVYLAKRYYDNVTPEQVRAYERHAQTEGGWYEETKTNYELYESNEDAWSWNVYGATTPEKRNVVYQGSNRGYIDVKENRGMLTGEIETEPDETIRVNVYVADKESGERQLIESFEFEEKGEFDIPYDITDDQYLSVEVSGGKVNSLSVGAYVPEKRGEDPQSNIDKYGEEEPTKKDLEEIENKTKHTKKR
jgi:RHS repeat-associated protein